MSHPANELKISETDEPNTVAIYVIIFVCIVGLALTFWALAEYKGYADTKRVEEIQARPFEQREALQKANEPLIEIINKSIESK